MYEMWEELSYKFGEHIMKKILLILLVTGFYINANAATTGSTLSLNGSVSSSCTSNFSNGTLSFTFVPGVQASAQNTLYTLNCTAGSVVSGFTATSANGWDFKGNTSSDLIHYTITANTIPTYSSYVVTTWSGATTVTTATNLLTGGSITINDAADPIASYLTVTPVTTPSGSNVDTYSDTVTIATVY